MKHLIIVIVLLLTPSIGFSEWKRIGKSDLGVWYIDASRIEVRNDYVYSWYLLNGYEPDAELDNSLSTVFYEKLDCVNNKYIELQASWYKAHFGEQFINSYTPDDSTWQYQEPNSVSEFISKLACKLAGQ